MSTLISSHICPACEGKLFIERLACTQCSTRIEGHFTLPRLARLSREHQQFIEVLLLSEGNLKEVGKRFSISYPTVRKRLEAVIEELAAQIQQDERDRRKESGKQSKSPPHD